MVNRLTEIDELVDVSVSDGHWSIGFDLQASTADSMLGVADPCSETSTLVAGQGGAQNGRTRVYFIQAFSAVVSARRNVRCANGEELEMVQLLLANGGTTGALEYALWNGVNTWDPNLQPSLQNNDVQTVAKGSSVADSVAAVINKYSTLTVLDQYIVHLGIQAALELSAAGYAYNVDTAGNLRVRATMAPIVVSPYYPSSGVAVTGPIAVNISETINAFQNYDYNLNRTNIQGNQTCALAFDPGTSVRAV